jgi:type VI secretion system protein
MHRSVTLLERLALAVRNGQARSLQEDRGATMRSILKNLQQVLNSRQGHALAQMDLGIPSPHELMQGFPGTLEQAQRAIRQCILRYEPRLAGAVVTYIKPEEGSQTIGFQVTAQLAGDGSRESLSFHTAISPDGRLRLRNA